MKHVLRRIPDTLLNIYRNLPHFRIFLFMSVFGGTFYRCGHQKDWCKILLRGMRVLENLAWPGCFRRGGSYSGHSGKTVTSLSGSMLDLFLFLTSSMRSNLRSKFVEKSSGVSSVKWVTTYILQDMSRLKEAVSIMFSMELNKLTS